jgi:hypothetical protein
VENLMNDTQSRLADMMKTNVGDPPGRVTVQAVQHQRTRRHVRMAGLVTAVAVIAAVSAGAGFRLTTAGPAPASAGTSAGVPRFYAQQGDNSQGHPYALIRATSTGKVTADFRCPWPKKQPAVIYPVAADAQGDFFMVCAKTLPKPVLGEVRIYRFHVTAAGKVGGYARIPGGNLGAVFISRLIVSPDGSRIAVLDSPASTGYGPGGTTRGRIVVIDTRTGARAIWRNAAADTDAARFYVTNISFGLDGRELVFEGDRTCGSAPNPPPCRPFDQQVRLLTPATRGGLFSDGRILLRRTQYGETYLGDATISNDGSTLTIDDQLIPTRHRPSSAKIIQITLSSGKQRVIYQLHLTTGGLPLVMFSSDASGRHFLIKTGPVGHPVIGRLDHGKLIKLRPFTGNLYDAW